MPKTDTAEERDDKAFDSFLDSIDGDSLDRRESKAKYAERLKTLLIIAREKIELRIEAVHDEDLT